MIATTIQAATSCTPDRAALFAGPLSDACVAFGITTPERIAAFLAQIGHESGSLRYTAELWGPTPAQARYEGRADLGNTANGDGYKYRGHGLIQVTGRFNHARARDQLRAKFGDQDVPDFEAYPEALELPRWAALSAANYWSANGCNELADAGDFESITRRINGGLNGQLDRLSRWGRAKDALSSEALEPSAPLEQTKELERPPAPSSTSMAKPPSPKGSFMAPIIAALLPSLIEAIPKLGALFAKSDTAKTNVKAAEIAFSVAKEALGATNEQEVIARVQADPAAAATVSKAIEDNWFQLTDAGGGGIDGARKADAATSGGDMLKSPTFWICLFLLPLVYLFALSLIGIIGTATWSDDVRAGLAGSIISAIIGGIVGYYTGQTTTRNRTPA